MVALWEHGATRFAKEHQVQHRSGPSVRGDINSAGSSSSSMISRSGYNFEKTRAPIAQAAEGYNDWSSTSTAMPSAGPSQGRSDKAAAYSEDMEVDDELGVELAADDLDAEHSYDAFAPGMLPVDDDAQDEDTGRTDRLRAAKDEHLSKAEGKKRAVDPDEDTDDMLDQALAGIGLVPLQTYLSDWESIMAARAKTRAEKDMAAAAAAKAAADGTKKKKKQEEEEGQQGRRRSTQRTSSIGGRTHGISGKEAERLLRRQGRWNPYSQ